MEKNYDYENNDNEGFQREQESETFPININNIKKLNQINRINDKKNNFLNKFWFFIMIFTLSFIIINSIINLNKNQKKEKEKFNLNQNIKNNNNENKNISKEIRYKRDINEKIGIAFIFEVIYGNGIGRMISLLTKELSKMNDKYDIYLISGQSFYSDFEIDEKIKRIPIYKNKTLIKEFDKTSNVIYYILHNVLYEDEIKFYQSFNKKIINIMHGSYLSVVYSKCPAVYQLWENNKLFDAFINVVPDDYYIYKQLELTNTFYIPNLLTFEPSKTPNSNLTYNNLMIMGRENDPLKGGIYAIKVMNLIVKEVPDAKLYFISSDYRIDSIKNLTKDLNLTNNIEFLPYISNITHYFLNSSVFIYPSITECFPMAMNEGKAHGVPIVAFNVSYSAPYQKGVIIVEMFNIEQMAKEAIKLLKNYEYRKMKGTEGKISLNEFSNSETINKWDRLFSILDKDDTVAYKKLQEYTYEKYYDEEKAKDRLESNYNFGKNYSQEFSCHSFNDIINPKYIRDIKSCNQ